LFPLGGKRSGRTNWGEMVVKKGRKQKTEKRDGERVSEKRGANLSGKTTKGVKRAKRKKYESHCEGPILSTEQHKGGYPERNRKKYQKKNRTNGRIR